MTRENGRDPRSAAKEVDHGRKSGDAVVAGVSYYSVQSTEGTHDVGGRRARPAHLGDEAVIKPHVPKHTPLNEVAFVLVK